MGIEIMTSQKAIQWQIILAYFPFITMSLVGSTPPEDPLKCSSGNRDCIIRNAYGAFNDRSICRAGSVEYPFTEEELISIVANATKQKKKMKVVTSTSHGTPKLVCPDGENGLLISTKYLNSVANVDKSAMTITVESGMTFRQLIDESAKAGLAIPCAPFWWGLTVGGLMSTGAHGSSLWGLGSAIHEYIVRLRIVTPAGPNEGYAKVRTLENGDPELDAAKVSLGVLGVISQVTFQLEPMFKRSITYFEKSDSDFGDEALTWGRKHEYGDFSWYPSSKKVVYRIDDRVPSNTSGDGVYDFIGSRSTSTALLATLRTTEETQEALGDANGKCLLGATTRTTLALAAYGLTNDGKTFKGYPVVGYNNKVQSTGTCLDSPNDFLLSACPWDPRIKGRFHQTTGVSIALSKVKYFIQDVQKLVDLSPKALCGLEIYNGILMRYIKASSAYLGKQEDSIEFDIQYYRSKDPNRPRLFQDILEEIEQIALFKYGGLPHWGKNRILAFDGLIKKFKNADKFLKVKQLYDPLGLFSNEWSDQILGLKNWTKIVKEGCALEGLCICSQDIHCAPKKGYFCRSGKVYTNARVCTKL